ncbi:hypothetical protein [Yersinia aldovae]|uniref:hypothetical protein n=1 Tax=Yersinia aldovae TaxID=29483 RepID=UPI0011A46F27|nr:hypothetical protein [Yersinia aldovae]
MNTQNINVKTATPKSSERYGKNTNILIQLIEMESKLQVLRSLAAVGCRDEEDFEASFSCLVNYGLKMSHSYALKVRHFKTGF